MRSLSELALGAASIVNNCVDLPTINNDFCKSVTRDASNNVSFVQRQYLNAAAYSTEGWDFSALYSMGLADMGLPDYGMLTMRADFTYLMTLNNNPLANNPTTYVQQAGIASSPKTRGNLSVRWEYEEWGVNATVHYLGGVRRNNADSLVGYSPETTGSWSSSDLRVDYKGFDNYTLFAGVNNIFDRNPPFVPFTYVGNSDRVSGVDGSLYSNLGRYLHAGVNIAY